MTKVSKEKDKNKSKEPEKDEGKTQIKYKSNPSMTKVSKEKDKNKSKEPEKDEGKNPCLLKFCYIRLLLIIHCVLACWRVVVAENDNRFWFLCCLNVLFLVEGFKTFNREKPVKRWRPCIAVYLITILPCVWLLQIHRYNVAAASMGGEDITTTQSTTVVSTTGSNGGSTTTPGILMSFANTILSKDDSTWAVVIQELMIFLIKYTIWFLKTKPKKLKLARFIAKASDIMELFALFDESAVQEDLTVTYLVLSCWSLSFIQFVLVLPKKGIARRIIKTLFQDGSFLYVRLFVAIDLQLVSYSLVFFLIKNLLSLMEQIHHVMGGFCIQLRQ
ncbi:transmembrane protein 26-like [Mya arenaria]|uniref:transmembrane protein 26-like n=1 Tax=Mya arenaria TaxID=6604 RepID=UPI0022E04F38|nr:transmembrane protein 26-like [Mya arenaria]